MSRLDERFFVDDYYAQGSDEEPAYHRCRDCGHRDFYGGVQCENCGALDLDPVFEEES